MSLIDVFFLNILTVENFVGSRVSYNFLWEKKRVFMRGGFVWMTKTEMLVRQDVWPTQHSLSERDQRGNEPDSGCIGSMYCTYRIIVQWLGTWEYYE